MEKSYLNSIVNISQTLHKHGVAFLVVGGAAVGFHGYARPSMESGGNKTEKPDFDFWYNPTYNNYYRLLNAIEDFGVDVSRYRAEKSPKPKSSFFKFEIRECFIDFLPVLQSPVKFKDAFLAREIITLQEVEIPFIGFNELLQDKQLNPREKDLPDIEMLKKIKGLIP